MQCSQHGHQASIKWRRACALGVWAGVIPDTVTQRTAPFASSKALEQAPALENSEQQGLQEASMTAQLPEADQVFNAG
jgi:hypothetical protein